MNPLVVFLAALVLLLAFTPSVQAHRGSPRYAEHILRATNMDKQCGNGIYAYCITSTKKAYVDRPGDKHTWIVQGYWEERRFGGHPGHFSCDGTFAVGPHHHWAIAWYPYTERCVHLRDY